MKHRKVKQLLLLLLMTASIVLITSEPSMEKYYLEILIATKAVGFGCAYLSYYLVEYKKWYNPEEDEHV